MASRVRRTPRTNEIWPGFVDALSTLLMVIIFLLVTFMLAQFFLSVAISGRDEALDRLSRQLSELSELLSLEQQANAELRLDIAQLSSELQSSTASRDELSAQLSLALTEQDELRTRLTSALDERDDLDARLASTRSERDALDNRLTIVLSERDSLDDRLTSVLSERDALDLRLTEVIDRARAAEAQAEALRAALAEAETTITADRETIGLKLAELASLRQDLAALRKVRADLEAQITQLAEVLDESRAAVARLENESERQRERNRVLVVRLGDADEETERERERSRALVHRLADAEAETEQERKDNRLVVIDLGKAEAALEASRAELTQLREEHTAVRDRSKRLEARLSDEAERTALAQSEIEKRDIRLFELGLAVRQSDEKLIGQKALSARAQAQVQLLNRQIIALRRQLARIAKALEAAEIEAEEQNIVIANLGQKLNLALAGKVEELQRYRSEFFGRLREVLGDRPGVQIVGDRFVFQSEVLFASGSAVLEEQGAGQMAQLAETLLEIARQIPDDLRWILRVDGHTDILPISTPQFPSNWELSTARAISVVRFLNRQGVPAEHLAATGFGEFQPIDPRQIAEAFRHNRRIELQLTNR